MQEACQNIAADDICKPVLLGNKDEIEKIRAEHGFDLSRCEIMDPDDFE
ncbi:MAG: hypothetical protein J6D18_02145, partial [Erysipelotrichaceae bacterium]|nr:hypothetical protein [Erysipelotrichaceae bacterium]